MFGALALAILGLAAAIPTLATAVFSGTLADRVDRLRLLRVTNAIALAGVVVLAILLYVGPTTVIHLPGPAGFFLPLWAVLALPLFAVVTITNSLARPAFNAALPRIVPAELLGEANGRILTTGLTVSAVGTLAAGVLTNYLGPVVALLVPLAFYEVAAIALATLRADLTGPRTVAKPPFLTDAREGFAFLAHNRGLLLVTATALGINFLSAIVTVEITLYVLHWLFASAVTLGALTFLASIGAAVGSSTVNAFRWERAPGLFLALFVVLQGLTVVILPLTHSVWIALPDVFLFGLFPGMYATVFVAAIQRTVPNEILGRVFAADEAGSFAMIPIGQYVGGVLTAFRGILFTYLLAGGGIALLGGLMAGLRDLRRFATDIMGLIPGGPPEATPTRTRRPTDSSR